MYKRYDFSNLTENEVSRLRPHPLNDKVYGTSNPDAHLQKSVETNGVFNPVIVNKNKEILSGTRRWRAAKNAGFKKIPVLTLLSRGADGLLGEQFLIESNRARVKTPETKAREFKELKRIERGLAKKRRNAGVPAKGPEGGEAVAKAAAAVGMGANTAKKIEAVIDAADGGDKKAQTVLKAVNAGDLSIAGAYRAVAKPKNPEKINAGVLEARELAKLFKNAEVTRSKRDGLFHVTVRDITPEQVRKLAKAI